MTSQPSRQRQPFDNAGNGSLRRDQQAVAAPQAPRTRRHRQDGTEGASDPEAPARANERAPEAMSSEERMRELGGILARSVARMNLPRKALADLGEREALSWAVVDEKENATP